MQELSGSVLAGALLDLKAVEAALCAATTALVQEGQETQDLEKFQAMRRSDWEHARSVIVLLRDECSKLQAESTVAAIDRALKSWNPDGTVGNVSNAVSILQTIIWRFNDELGARRLFSLTRFDAEFYDNGYFSNEITVAFAHTSEDLEESCKCMALGRYTAVVFHLMRAMERAVQVLTDKLGIKEKERVWGNLLADVSKEIEKMPKGGARNEWSECLTLLYHVKQAWRNDVMHPKQTYTEQQAEDVLRSVRSFMGHLARLV